MTDIMEQILNLMMDNGKSASDITKKLKILGNGSMQKGLIRIKEFFENDATARAIKERSKGRQQGVIIGAFGTVTLGAIIAFAAKEKKKKTAHEAEGREILNVMESKISASESSIDAMDSSDTDFGDDKL